MYILRKICVCFFSGKLFYLFLKYSIFIYLIFFFLLQLTKFSLFDYFSFWIGFNNMELSRVRSGLILQNCCLLDILLKAVVKSNKAVLPASYWKQKDKHKINGWPGSALQWWKPMHVSQIIIPFFLEQVKHRRRKR